MGEFSISILSEEAVSDPVQAREKGGVWLQVMHESKKFLSYLAPDHLIAWVEGDPIKKHVVFTGLDEKQNEQAFKLFDQELHKLFK
ncbi:MAG: hypothetical protein OEX83_10270 [Gammaproteobacteria bacterium]|nr:hypothetical protein [Gammaproteobacteria bacterium]